MAIGLASRAVPKLGCVEGLPSAHLSERADSGVSKRICKAVVPKDGDTEDSGQRRLSMEATRVRTELRCCVCIGARARMSTPRCDVCHSESLHCLVTPRSL